MSSNNDLNVAIIKNTYENDTLSFMINDQDLEHMINEANAFFENALREYSYSKISRRNEQYLLNLRSLIQF
jgi:hypothetical protein